MSDMRTLFLIDAYPVLYRAYYAIYRRRLTNSKGINTSVILGFVNTLHEILSKEKPKYLAVAFDKGKTFRHELLPSYKANRKPQPMDIRTSVPIVKSILEALHIPCLECAGYEADDVIGTVATYASAQNVRTYMLTPDKDFAQLVNDNIYQYSPKKGGGYEVLDSKAVCKKYKLSRPSQMIDLLSLMGDTADNYKGCPGIGPMSAQYYIEQYDNVDNFLAHQSELPKNPREAVERFHDSILLSRTLATICTTVPIDITLEAMEVKLPDTAALKAIFDELEFKNMVEKFVEVSTMRKRVVRKGARRASVTGATEYNEGDIFSASAFEEAPAEQ